MMPTETSSIVPRELLRSIFTLAGTGPNATYLGNVCRDWHSVFEELLYSTISIFDRETIHQTYFNCDNYNKNYYLKKDDQKHGISIEKDSKCGDGASWRQLGLLVRTLSLNNNRLASYVREMDFCANLTDFTSFLSITRTLPDLTHLYLRGPEANDPSLATTVKAAINSLSGLQVFSSEGVFPLFSMLDTIALLRACPNIRRLTVGLVSREPDVKYLDARLPSHQSYGKFPELRELCFIPLMERDDAIFVSFPSSKDTHILSKISFPNLVSFSASLDEGSDPESIILMKRCLTSWAPHLTKLQLMGESSFNEIAPSLTHLVDLKCDRHIFSKRTILNFRSLKRLDIRGYIDVYEGIIQDGFKNGNCERTLPHLTHITTYACIRDESDRTEMERRLLGICQARNITVERTTYSDRKRVVILYYD